MEVTDKSTFRISDPAVATISSQGDIKAIAPGNTVVTAVYGNAEAQSLIKVTAIPEPSPVLTMVSDKTSAGPTERVIVTLKAPQASDLYGFQLHLSYDAARLAFEKDTSALLADNQGKLTSLSSDTKWTVNIVYADINGEGRIRLDDLILVGKAFGTHVGEPGFNPIYDLTGDGVVNAADLEAVKSKMEPPF